MLENCSVRGSALIYILIAIALVAALTSSLMQPASQQTRTQNSFKLAAEINGQVQMIRASIQDCILLYPKGDKTIDSAHNGGYYKDYPLEPDSTHLPVSFRAANKNVENLRCPGNSPGDPDSDPADATLNEHVLIFGGSKGRFMPAPPALFSAWTYRNGGKTTPLTIEGQSVSGVYFQITTTNTDAYLAEAMQKVDSQFTACETDYIAGDGTNGCAANTKCLRVWVVRDAPACP